jgi:hypothetical protein
MTVRQVAGKRVRRCRGDDHRTREGDKNKQTDSQHGEFLSNDAKALNITSSPYL